MHYYEEGPENTKHVTHHTEPNPTSSQPHVITDKFANKIGLEKISVDISLHAVNELSTNVRYTTTATFRSRYTNLEHNLSLFVVSQIGAMMPTLPINRNSFKVPHGLVLADPEFHKPAEVNMILGAQYFYQFLYPGQISITSHSAVFQETELGWVVAGCFHQTQTKLAKVYCNFTRFSNSSLLWELDSGQTEMSHSQEGKDCESHYVQNTTRDQSGRYTVHLPFNENKSKIGESRNTVFNCFYSLEAKFSRNSALKDVLLKITFL